MNKFQISIFAFIACILLIAGITAQDSYTYYSYPNQAVPGEGESIWDTIGVPIEVTIGDINFYAGIPTYYTYAGQLIVNVTSPWGEEVTLHWHNQNRVLPIWFDTDEEEDGPGDLDDYIGHNAQGNWIMEVHRWAGYVDMNWQSWAIEINGETTGIVDEASLPLLTGLNGNYPNPFNSKTLIRFSLAAPGEIRLELYDIIGRKVRSFDKGRLDIGYHQIAWDGTNEAGEPVSSGSYIARLIVTEDKVPYVFSRKLIMVK